MKAWNLGVQHFNAGEFWEAHEEWEAEWRILPQPAKGYIQALIQTCGILIHLKANRRSPALSLCTAVLGRLENSPPHSFPDYPQILGLREFLLGLRDSPETEQVLYARGTRLKAELKENKK